MSPREISRFLAKVYKEQQTGCWRWLGCRGGSKQSYGQLTLNGKVHHAHRVAYTQWVGPVPPGLELDHLCRNPLCCNPAHLQPVTHRENCRRGRVGQHNASKTHCIHGHPFSPANTRLRLSRGSTERVCIACTRKSKPHPDLALHNLAER